MARTKPTYRFRFSRPSYARPSSPRDTDASHRVKKKEDGPPKSMDRRASRRETSRERRYRLRNMKKEAEILKKIKEERAEPRRRRRCALCTFIV